MKTGRIMLERISYIWLSLLIRLNKWRALMGCFVGCCFGCRSRDLGDMEVAEVTSDGHVNVPTSKLEESLVLKRCS